MSSLGCSWRDRPLQRAFADPAVRYALGLYGILRLGLSVMAAAAAALVPSPGAESTLTTTGLRGLLVEVWLRFDALRYIEVAEHGYAADPSNLVFPPFYPALIRAFSPLLLGDTGLAALLVSNVALVLALIALYRWVQARGGDPPARRTLLFLAAFPAGFFLLGGYTESLFLLLAVTSLHSAESGGWARAGVSGMLAALTRKEGGLALTISLAYLYLQRREVRWSRPGGDILWLGLVPAGFVAYLLLPTLVLDTPLGWDRVTALWGLRLATPWEQLAAATRSAFGWPIPLLPALDLLSTLGISISAWAVWLRDRPFGLYMGALLATYLVWLSPEMPLVSMTRHALLFFPGFWLLAERLGSAASRRAVLVGSTILLIYLTALFAVGEWVG